MKSEVADEATLDDPVRHLLRRNAHYERSVGFTRGVPAIKPGESRDLETIVESLVFLLQLRGVLCSPRADGVQSNAMDQDLVDILCYAACLPETGDPELILQ